MKPPVLVYCHCQYAQVLPEDVKRAALKHLSDSGEPFEAVPDLCELSARRDPALARIASAGPVKIAACFPRAVKWLFHSGGAPLSLDHTEIINMRTLAAAQVGSVLKADLAPNLPTGKVTAGDHPTAASA